MFFAGEGSRRLSCSRLTHPRDAANADAVVVRLGAPAITPAAHRMLCTCAPVSDYTGREVARVGVFTHASDERTFSEAAPRAAWELARLISMRLGYLPAAAAIA
jgi:hypothetical protein